MRAVLCCLAIACGCDGRDSNERLDARANPHLTVEPITLDAGVTRSPAPKRASIGDHRRREEDEAKERRRDKANRQPEAQRSNAEAEQKEAERREAERRRLTETPLETLTPPRW